MPKDRLRKHRFVKRMVRKHIYGQPFHIKNSADECVSNNEYSVHEMFESEELDFETESATVQNVYDATEADSKKVTYCTDIEHGVSEDVKAYSFKEANRDDHNKDDSLLGEIAQWAVNKNVTHSALNGLLQVLGKYHTLPRDARTILKTARSNHVRKMMGLNGVAGEFVYFGVETELLNSLELSFPSWLLSADKIHLLFNVDGLPLYNSSSRQFWPILAKIYDHVNNTSGSNIFCVAVYCGTSKPLSVDDFFKEFTDELQFLLENGITWSDKQYHVEVKGFLCDAPARAFVKCVKGHTGYYSCEKCEQRGRYVAGRLTFPELDSTLRSDGSFAQQTQEEHHKGVSPLTLLGIGLVTKVPLDYMHLVCLGVVKKLMHMWIHGAIKVKISCNQVECISDDLVKQASCKEFARKPRSLRDLDRWKAVEYRQFLMYYGPVVLRSVLPSKLYHHFMLLVVAITVLCSKVLCADMISYARRLLKEFVKQLTDLYGTDCVVYNMHNLLHLCDDVNEFGLLDQFSCFQFESTLGIIKRKLRSGNRPLAQFCRRKSENCSLFICETSADVEIAAVRTEGFIVSGQHFAGPTKGLRGEMYSKLCSVTSHFTVDINTDSDCFAMTNSHAIIKVCNIIVTPGNVVKLIGRIFEVQENFFSYPCVSEMLHIYKLSQLSTGCSVYNVRDIDVKCLLQKRKNYYISFPLLHCSGANAV